ncbi:MAG: hypothetical protein K1X79_03375 [Oligoflexia bacterium]|nr:hypothetical protein [Oligoflexia bacterium]
MPYQKQSRPNLFVLASSSKEDKPLSSPNQTGKIHFNGIYFASVAEAVCGQMLELFVPGFAIRYGETFQISIGSGRSVDFLVQGVLVEFHGVRFRPERRRYGDFTGARQFQHFRRQMRRSGRNRWRRARVLEEARREMTQNYYHRRCSHIKESLEHGTRELVVATTCDEFYDFVIRRFNREFCPTRYEFREIFFSMIKVVVRQNFSPAAQRRRA